MKSVFLPVTLLALIISAFTCKAQDAQLTLKTPPAKIVVDGNIKEWGDSLSYYSPAEHLNYMIANTGDTLYLAVKIYDRMEMARVLKAGLTFILDPRGKKKETFSLTYPLNVGGSPDIRYKEDEAGGVSRDDRDDLLKEKLTTLRGIKMIGYKDIEGDMITTSNSYGIRAAVDYDEAGNLVYEEAIPLKFFHADLSSKNEWAFDIKINGFSRPPGADKDGGPDDHGGGMHGGPGGGAMGGGPGGGGGMGGGGRHGGAHRMGGDNASPGELSKSIDFWGKFYLAK